MTEKEKVEVLKKVNFGDIDANADPNLDKYFIDNNYWERIVESPIYYVVGKKGTGKSAIYQYLFKVAYNKGVIFSNRDFGDFPFEKIIQLSDDSFSKPNQYQSIWEHLILNIFIDMIIKNEVADENECYKQLKKYYDICIGDTVNLHKESLAKVQKTSFSLVLSKLGITPSIDQENELSQILGSGDSNISAINKRLISLIETYLTTRNDNSSYIIQFDRLDDTYNQYTDVETYYQMIISLLKIVYAINNRFRFKNINNVKIIVYLRSDIIGEIGKRDSESARWDDYTYKISWAIINKNDWENPLLLQVVNKRISTSIDENISFFDIFETEKIDMRNYDLLAKKLSKNTQDVFKYIIDKTFHRPRDLVQFCKYIQKEVCETSGCEKITFRNVKNAEKKYAFWLINSELSNEINPIIKDVDTLWELLVSIGRQPFSATRFKEKYNQVDSSSLLPCEKLIEYLYDVGVFVNVQFDKYHNMIFRSAVRNEGKVNKQSQLMIHPGVWIGINS